MSWFGVKVNKIKVYNQKGEAIAEETLSTDIFDLSEKSVLVAQAVRVQMANARQSIAHTKTRGEVSGGGKKPWKQKGTGNARAGSTRSPLWTGGGITFGPRNSRNFSLRLSKKMRQGALKAVLSQKAQEKKLILVKDFELEKISTKTLARIFQTLPIESGKILLVLPEMKVNLELSAANLPFLKVIKANNLNILDLLNHDYLIVTTDALVKINEIFGKKEKLSWKKLF